MTFLIQVPRYCLAVLFKMAGGPAEPVVCVSDAHDAMEGQRQPSYKTFPSQASTRQLE